MVKNRVPEYKVLDVIVNRWSPRAMSDEPISREELMRLFEAARWAPSSYNNQPWRFVYAFKGSPAWGVLFNVLVPFNQSWAKNGGVLAVILSSDTFEYNGNPSRTHSFDTGAAWQNLALQGWSMGLVVHGMEGFDYERVRAALNVPEDYTVEAMFVVGRPGDRACLDPELQEREVPSGRKRVDDFAFEGCFPEL